MTSSNDSKSVIHVHGTGDVAFPSDMKLSDFQDAVESHLGSKPSIGDSPKDWIPVIASDEKKYDVHPADLPEVIKRDPGVRLAKPSRIIKAQHSSGQTHTIEVPGHITDAELQNMLTAS